MHTIEIDDEVFNELSRQATGFHVTPNDVLRRLLNLATPSVARTTSASNGAPWSSAAIPPTLPDFIRSERFGRHHQAVDKFLASDGFITRIQNSFRRWHSRFGAAPAATLQSPNARFYRAAMASLRNLFRSHRSGFLRRWTTNRRGSSSKTCCGRWVTRPATLTWWLLSCQTRAFAAVMHAAAYLLLSNATKSM